MELIKIRKPDDFHVHLRQGKILRDVMGYTARHFARSLVMPNTLPPIRTADDARRYLREIDAVNRWSHRPLMSIKLTTSTNAKTVRQAKASGVVAGKLYPEGVTTNSADGIRNFHDLWPVFDAMQDESMVLCVHGEMPGVFVLDREREFLSTLSTIAEAFPQLRIVFEHVSTLEAVQCIAQLPANVAATITVHHLFLTLDDVIGDLLEPHHFCKPVAKGYRDREALIEAALSGSPKFFLGTDSAPHSREKKECASGCAGIFTSPVAMPILAELFSIANLPENLEGFTSVHGARFYRLPLNEDRLTLVQDPWTVPQHYAGVVPFRAGETLNWRVSGE